MQSEIQAHIAFHLAGKKLGGGLDSIAGRGLLPALFAGYRDLTRLRYDFPLVLIPNQADGASVQSLSGLIDDLLREVTGEDDGERLRRHAWRLEREIRALVARGVAGNLRMLWETAASHLAVGDDEPLRDSLRRLRAALKTDGAVVDCDRSMPFCLLRHEWKAVQGRRVRAVRKTIDDLITRLSDLLAAEFVRSAEGLSAERLKVSLGASQHDAFDFAVMSRLLTEASPNAALPEGRRRRIEWLLSVLKSQRFFPAMSQGDTSVAGTSHEFVFESCAEAMKAFRERRAEMSELARALAMAELEVEGRYHAATHDPLFEDDAHDPDTDRLALFPDYLIRCRPDEVPAVLKALAAGLPAKVLVQSDDLMESPAIDDERLALNLATKQFVGAAIGLNTVYVLQAASSNLFRLRDQISRALAWRGPALFNVFSGATGSANGVPAYLVAAAATESRGFPDFVYDPAGGPHLALRFQVLTNPQPLADWPVQDFSYEDEAHQRISERLPFTLIDFAACDHRYARHFAHVPHAKWNGSMAPVAEFMESKPGELLDKVPYLLMVDADNVLHKVIVDGSLLREARQCAQGWQVLQELGGLRNSHAAEPPAQAREAAAEPQQSEAPVSARPAASAAPVAPAVTPPTPDSIEAERRPDDPYIETARCSSCNECIQINGQMFAYDANRQASIVNPDAGTYRQLVEAAESCQVSVIHPGKPRNSNEPGLDELIKRAEPFL